MTGTLQQIKTAYEVSGMTPSQIAEDQELDLAAVKAALMNCSSKYRKECGVELPEEDTLNFSDDELRQVNKVILETALMAENPDGSTDFRTRLAAAVYLRDDKKGRKEARHAVGGNTFNILQFNQMLQQARIASSRVKELVDI